jgi:DNA-binding IscR family transcriptional regulator
VRLNICVTSDRACNRQGPCPAHSVWVDAQQAMVSVLGNANIADLAKREEAAPPSLTRIETPKWN